MRRPDVTALVSGLLLTSIAVLALLASFTGVVGWQLVRTVAPLALVAAGGLGLVLARNRADN